MLQGLHSLALIQNNGKNDIEGLLEDPEQIENVGDAMSYIEKLKSVIL